MLKLKKKQFNWSKKAIPISDLNMYKTAISETFPCAKKGSMYFVS